MSSHDDVKDWQLLLQEQRTGAKKVVEQVIALAIAEKMEVSLAIDLVQFARNTLKCQISRKALDALITGAVAGSLVEAIISQDTARA